MAGLSVGASVCLLPPVAGPSGPEAGEGVREDFGERSAPGLQDESSPGAHLGPSRPAAAA